MRPQLIRFGVGFVERFRSALRTERTVGSLVEALILAVEGFLFTSQHRPANQTRMIHLSRLICLWALAVAYTAWGAAPSRPNILFIMTDDHAAHALSCYGSRINNTPNLDRIAKTGMRFERCFVVNSICAPSRASILTGKYSHLNGVPVFNRFDGSQPHIARMLRDSGYFTGMIGKWHLGSAPTGFDVWSILPGQGAYHNPAFLTPQGRTNMTGYATDLITDQALDFIKHRPKDRPFFLMYHHKAPHRPWEPDAKHARLYEDVQIPEPETFKDTYDTRSDAAREATMTIARHLTRRDLKLVPPQELQGAELQKWLGTAPDSVEVERDGKKVVLDGEALVRWKYQRYIKDYLRCVASVDDNVGRVLDYLEQSGLRSNTVVVYTSDQGFFLGDHGWYDKRFMYEESLRMPLLTRWPGVISEGSVQKAMSLNIDFAPTFAEIAGLKPSQEFQGKSLLPLLQGRKPSGWREAMYYRYYHDPGDHNTRAHYGIRTATHKLIYFWKIDQWECYDLRNDPHEVRNIAQDPKQAKVVAQLKKELQRLKSEARDNDEFADKQPPPGVDGQTVN